MVDAPGLCSLALGCQQCITTPAHRAPTPQPKHKPRTTTTEWMHRCWPHASPAAQPRRLHQLCWPDRNPHSSRRCRDRILLLPDVISASSKNSDSHSASSRTSSDGANVDPGRRRLVDSIVIIGNRLGHCGRGGRRYGRRRNGYAEGGRGLGGITKGICHLCVDRRRSPAVGDGDLCVDVDGARGDRHHNIGGRDARICQHGYVGGERAKSIRVFEGWAYRLGAGRVKRNL